MKLCKKDIQVNVFKFPQGIFDTYCPIEDMTNFLYLPGKLTPLTLIKAFTTDDLSSQNRELR